MILIITNKEDVTADFVVVKLQLLNVPFYRLNTEDLYRSLTVTLDFTKKKFVIHDEKKQIDINLQAIKAVYYRRPQPTEYFEHDLSQGENFFLTTEASYVLEGLYQFLRDKVWLNNVYDIRKAENKIYQLSLASEIGFTIPHSIITNDYERFVDFYNDNSGDCIIKPIHCGRIAQVEQPEVVYTCRLLEVPSPEVVSFAPSYLQNRINKMCDVRVTVVGDKIFTTEIESQENKETLTDWRRGEHILKHVKSSLPAEIEHKCFQLLKLLNLHFGAIDFIKDITGNYIFLEINPNGQWAWIETQTGFDLSGEIARWLKSKEVL